MNAPTVLAFDVFGTVVDWYGTIRREVGAMGLGIDPGEFALAWRAGYQPAMQRVRSGQQGWTSIDRLHRSILDGLIERFGLHDLDETARAHLNNVWHRLDPWPDSVRGLARLRRRFTICTLSNGNLALLADMAKHGGLPWDLILSAEVFRAYKPDPRTYLGVCDVFSIEPQAMMMVAAHRDDLAAARACGCRTAFVGRPGEYGPNPPAAHVEPAAPLADFEAPDLDELADQLGCPSP